MSGTVIRPGASLPAAAGALTVEQKGVGVFPYQWIFPGPAARPVIAEGVIAPAAVGAIVTVVKYQVPRGERFTLDGVVFQYLNGNSWVEGSGDLVWSLILQGAASNAVEWFVNITTRRGSNVTGPYPVPKTLEFTQGSNLLIQARTVANVSNGLLLGQIVGHTYPNSEAV